MVSESNAYTKWLEQKTQWQIFKEFALQVKADLEKIYAGKASKEGNLGEGKDTADVLAQRQNYLAQIQSCYEKNKAKLGGGRYDNLMRSRFNNAFLVSLGTYEDFFPAFGQLFRQVRGDWSEFYIQVAVLAKLSANDRAFELAQLLQAASAIDSDLSSGSGQQKIAAQANNNNAEEVHCDAFADHGLN